ncbi:MAG: GNAT family N-acetyltransferase [Dehalococcoidia bacterium]|nr:GNAT family N-acetyltransferase [Dehalococcoidia bacterium]
MTPPEGTTIRRADEGDASRIASIHVRSKRVAYRAFMPDGYVDTLDQDEHRLNRWQPYFAAGIPENRAWIAFVRGIPAGFVALERIRQPDTAPAGYLHLHHLHIAPEFRGRGIGQALLDTAVEDARSQGTAGLALWTQAGNGEARAFYERAGWQPDGAERGQQYRWEGGEFTMDDVRYVRSLD